MRHHAFVTCLIKNDSYLPGALVLAHALREQETRADLVCLVTPDITPAAVEALHLVYDRVICVQPIVTSASRDQRRQYVDQVLTRVQALRLGADGDLGCAYRKVVLLDADILPIRCYDHLFLVDAPAGIVNERADLFKRTDGSLRYTADGALSHGRWQWHHHYRAIPHGAPVPRAITDRVVNDPANYGVHTALLVLEPSAREFERIRAELAAAVAGPGSVERAPEPVADAGARVAAHLEAYRWPDMQYLTAAWSGRWHNVDLCFAGLCGYPDLSLLFGTHFAGPKPWDLRSRTVTRRFRRFPDFRRWYRELLETADAYPRIIRLRRIERLVSFADESTRHAVQPGEVGRFDPMRGEAYVSRRRPT